MPNSALHTAFSEDNLYRMLQLEKPEEAALETTLRKQNEGQHVDMWSMLAHNPQCAVSVESNYVTGSVKPRILLSAGQLKHLVATVGSMAFLSSLFAHFDCYLWEGQPKFTDLTKIKDAQHFLSIKERLNPAHEEEVHYMLARTGQSLSQYKVLDDFALQTAMGIVPPTKGEYFTSDPHTLAIEAFPFDDALWAHLAKESRIDRLQVTHPISPKLLTRITTFFPHITKLELVYKGHVAPPIMVPEHIRDVRLSIPISSVISDAVFAPHAHLQSVEIVGPASSLNNVDISKLPGLKSFTTTLPMQKLIRLDATELTQITIPYTQEILVGPHLPKGHISPPREIFIDSCVKHATLHKKAFDTNPFSFYFSPSSSLSLESLSLHYRTSPKDFSNAPLWPSRVLKLKHIHLSDIAALPRLLGKYTYPQVTSFSVGYCTTSDLPLLAKLADYFPNLETLHLEEMSLSSQNSFSLPPLPKLKILSIVRIFCPSFSCKNAHALETLQCTTGIIDNLDIASNAQLKVISCPPYTAALQLKNIEWPAHFASLKSTTVGSSPLEMAINQNEAFELRAGSRAFKTTILDISKGACITQEKKAPSLIFQTDHPPSSFIQIKNNDYYLVEGADAHALLGGSLKCTNDEIKLEALIGLPIRTLHFNLSTPKVPIMRSLHSTFPLLETCAVDSLSSELVLKSNSLKNVQISETNTFSETQVIFSALDGALLPQLEQLDIGTRSIILVLDTEAFHAETQVCPHIRSMHFKSNGAIRITPNMMQYLSRIASPHCTIRFSCTELEGLEQLPAHIEVIKDIPELEKIKEPEPKHSQASQASRNQPPSSSQERKRPEQPILQAPTSRVAWTNFNTQAITPDTAIKPSKSLQESGNFAIEMCGQDTHPAHNRIRILDTIATDPKDPQKIQFDSKPIDPKDLVPETIAFEQPINFTSHTQVKREQALNSSTLRTVCMEGSFKPGFYPLVKNEATRSLSSIACKPSGNLKLFWHEKHRCHYFQVEKAQDLQLVFHYERPKIYEILPRWLDVTLEKGSLLDPTLHKEVEKCLKKSKNLAFMRDTKLPASRKLEQLYAFVHAFDIEDFAGMPKSVLEGMFMGADAEDGKGTGVCRHRSELYMLLAHYLGCPVQAVVSSIHEYIEIPTRKGELHRLDLGGAPAEITPPAKTPTWLTPEKNTAATPQLATPSSSQAPTLEKEEKSEDVPYEEAMAPLLGKRHIEHWEHFFEKLSAPSKKAHSTPLLTLHANQSAHACNASLLQDALKNKRIQNPLDQHVFIQFPHELENLLHPIVIDEKTGFPIPHPARPLDKVKLLVIDWTHFTDNERVIFQSIMDTPPTLAGTPLPESVQVIGLMEKAVVSAKAFTTRVHPFTVSDTLLAQDRGTGAATTKPPLSIPLHHTPLWREVLLGAIRLENGQYLYANTTPFLEALKKGHPVHFVNPPKNDPEWEAFYARLNYERKYFANGAYHTVPEHMQFGSAHGALTQEAENVKIDATGPLPGKAIPISVHNWFELFTRTVPDQTHGAKTAKGFLDTHTEFTLQGSIPSHFMSQLYAYAEAHYPKKQFSFTLSPGANIENGTERPFTEKDPLPPVTLSSDTDFTLKQWKKTWPKDQAFPLVITVHPGMSIGDLCEKLRVTFDPTTHLPKIEYVEQALLTELLRGRKVILHGAVNNTVYQALFSPTSNIVARGELHTLPKDALTLLMPQTDAKTLPLPEKLESLEHTYDHYLKEIPEKDHDIAQAVFAFMDYARKLPLDGIGKPKQLTLPFARLENMISAFKNPSTPLNKHNPIKGVFLYNFPHGSEEYCTLNVLGKYFFASDDPDNAPRITALRALTEGGIDRALKDHPWKLLNCFRGETLVDILGFPLPDTFPALPQDVLERLRTHIDKTLEVAPDTQELAVSSYRKPEAALEAAVNSRKTQLLFFMGEPGVGKTHLIRTFKEKWKAPLASYDGIASIRSCFENAEKEKGITKLLLLDEADMQLPGVFDLFKALARGDTEVYWDGALLPVPSHLIVCGTGNGLALQGRYEHTVFQDYGRTVIIKNPTDAFLTQDVILPQLQKAHLPEHTSSLLLAIFRHVQKTQPEFARSLRDLESFTSRFVLLSKGYSETQALRLSAEGEFLGSYMNEVSKDGFLAFLDTYAPPLAKTTSSIHMLPVFKDIAIPDTRKHLLSSFLQSLSLVEEGLKGKRGVLLEGPPGAGKSKLAVAVMQKKGYLPLDAKILADWKLKDLLKEGVTADLIDPSVPKGFPLSDCFLQLNAGTKNIAGLLEKIAKCGMKVILDEINADQELEPLINQYGCGYDMEGKMLPPSFFFSATQNFAAKGTKTQSPALLNRCTMLHMPELTKEERIAIAQSKGFKSPERFVGTFENVANASDQNNDRMFYKIVKWFEHKAEFLVPKKQPSVAPVVSALPAIPLAPKTQEQKQEKNLLKKLLSKREKVDFVLSNPPSLLARKANEAAIGIMDAAIDAWKKEHDASCSSYGLHMKKQPFVMHAVKQVVLFFMHKYGLEECPKALITQLGKITSHTLLHASPGKNADGSPCIDSKGKEADLKNFQSDLLQKYGSNVEPCVIQHAKIQTPMRG